MRGTLGRISRDIMTTRRTSSDHLSIIYAVVNSAPTWSLLFCRGCSFVVLLYVLRVVFYRSRKLTCTRKYARV